MIDLHLHTTASDGRCDVPTLLRVAWEAGLRTIAVADHDTTAAVDDATALGRAMGIRVIPGIEITAVSGGRDVHVLGYFMAPHDGTLAVFLEAQRVDRLNRIREIGLLLDRLGKPIDTEALLEPGRTGREVAIGRPVVARALVAAGHVSSMSEAFDTLIGDGCPAWVPRRGAPPPQVFELIANAGGVASLAHPGLLRDDALIPEWVEAGLRAIEVYHTDHPPADTMRYEEMARRLGLAMTGGSDFHGEEHDGRSSLGIVTLPPEAFVDLEARARR